MTSYVTQLKNSSGKYVSLIMNNDSGSNFADFYKSKNNSYTLSQLAITGQEKSDEIQTNKGMLFFYDETSQILGTWDDAEKPITFATGVKDGTKFRIEVDSGGDIKFVTL